MPKIIENVRELLLEEAKKQIKENGYAQTTIRSVAKACGLGIGTVYNYFRSKDMLIASFMAEDWSQCLQQMDSHITDDAEMLLRGICESLSAFIQKYNGLFCDSDAAKVYATAFTVRHKQLRDQIAERLKPVCRNSPVEDKEFLAEWIAESLLTWTVAGKEFEKQFQMISQLIK